MKTIQYAYWAHLLAAVAALSIGYAQGSSLTAALVIVFLGSVWYYAQLRGGRGLETMFLYGVALAGAVGFWFAMPAWMMLVSVTAALGAWDLDHFTQRLRSVARVDMETGLGREHLRRLLLVEGLGLLAGLAALTTRVQVSFWIEVLLVLLALFGIGRLVLYVKRQME